MERSVVDVVVIGGGPAGSAAARLLASWGHSVTIVARSPRHPALAESLPPSCTKLFDQLGVQRVIDDAGFVRATGNTVCWANGEPRVERFAAGVAGYQVPRDAFDGLLFDAARVAGAARREGTVREVLPDGDSLRVCFDTPSGPNEIKARWVLDSSGRAGVLARRGLRRAESGGRTTAVVAVWERSDSWGVEEDTHTLVESYPGGWAWSVPVSATRRFVTVMLDPSVTDLPGRPRLAAAYGAELANTRMLRSLIDGAQMTGDPWGCDASPYTATRAFDGHSLLLGDAASFVDPLSSFGIKKALASAWLGAVAVHTALTDESMTTPALELFAERERAMYDHLQRQSAALSLEAAGAHAGEFWSARGDAEVHGQTAEELDVSALRNDQRVLAAFEELKQRPFVALRTSDSVRVVARAAVRGHRVVLEDHLAAPATPNGVRYCRNVNLVVITQLAHRYDQVPDLYDAYNRATAPAPLPDFLGALSALIGLELLDFA